MIRIAISKSIFKVKYSYTFLALLQAYPKLIQKVTDLNTVVAIESACEDIG